MVEKFDVIVIGGGTAGLVTASGCARLGKRVALIEKEALGGDCLWTGCVPTKALVSSAKLAWQMRNAHEWGLPPSQRAIAPRDVMASMREARQVVSMHDDPERFRKLGVSVIEGDARFVSRNEVEAGGHRFAARDVVIATGSRTAVPPIEGLAEAGYIDHATFLDRDELPRSLVVLGGGYIGVEFAQIFRRFGCEVTIVEMANELVAREDHDVIAAVRNILLGEGIELRTGWTVKRVTTANGKKVVHIECPDEPAEQIETAEIFVATGRRGNIEGLGLDEIGVRTERSWVTVNKYLETSAPRIWACGDVHGGLQFTHVAAYEAVKLVRNMLFPGRSAADYTNVPWTLFTDPEVAHIGLTEREARAQLGDGVRIYRADMHDVDRAVVDWAASGFVKIVCDSRGRILGGHVVSAGASSLIGMLVLARKQRLKIGDLAQIVTPYPSFADAIGRAATKYYEGVGASWIGRMGRRLAAWSQ